MSTFSGMIKQDKDEREAALKSLQQEYDQSFAAMAKKWKINAETSTLHMNFAKLFCKQEIQDPYREKANDIANRYGSDFITAISTQNTEKMNAVATKMGTELGTLNALQKRKAQANGCELGEITAQDLIDKMVSKI